jgi:O-antigen/teichoic acid export membrane protein
MIKRLLSSQLRINMVSGTLVTVVNAAVLAVAYPVYLHYLGYELYGVWLVLATVLTFAQLGNLGVGHAVTKLVAEEHGRGDLRAAQQYVVSAMVTLGISGVVILGVIVAFRVQIIGVFKLSAENAKTALWLLPYIGCLSIYVFIIQVLNGTLAGLGRMDLANYAQTGGRVVMVGVATLLLSRGVGMKSILIGNTCSYVTIHVASVILIRRVAPMRFLGLGNFSLRRCRRLIGFGGGVFGSSLLGMLVSPFNKLMLSRYAGVERVSVYELTFQAAGMFRLFFESAIRAIMPEISRLHGESSACARERIRAIKRRAMKLILLLGLPLCVVLMLAAEPLLKTWLGGRYLDAITDGFRVMLGVVFVSLLSVPAHYTIMGMGRVRYFIVAGIIGAGGNFAFVTAYYILTGRVSVNSLGMCMILTFSASSIYLIARARHLLVNPVE